jgi:hypothetical protein
MPSALFRDFLLDDKRSDSPGSQSRVSGKRAFSCAASSSENCYLCFPLPLVDLDPDYPWHSAVLQARLTTEATLVGLDSQ